MARLSEIARCHLYAAIISTLMAAGIGLWVLRLDGSWSYYVIAAIPKLCGVLMCGVLLWLLFSVIKWRGKLHWIAKAQMVLISVVSASYGFAHFESFGPFGYLRSYELTTYGDYLRADVLPKTMVFAIVSLSSIVAGAWSIHSVARHVALTCGKIRARWTAVGGSFLLLGIVVLSIVRMAAFLMSAVWKTTKPPLEVMDSAVTRLSILTCVDAIIFAIAGAVLAVLAFRLPRKVDFGHCFKCGYLVQEGRCPECGVMQPKLETV